jgi:hypothetical protein
MDSRPFGPPESTKPSVLPVSPKGNVSSDAVVVLGSALLTVVGFRVAPLVLALWPSAAAHERLPEAKVAPAEGAPLVVPSPPAGPALREAARRVDPARSPHRPPPATELE